MISFLININQWLKRSNVNNILIKIWLNNKRFHSLCGFFLLHIFILSNVLSFYLCVTCLKQWWCRNKFYYSILFIYYLLLDNSWLSYMCLYHLQDKTKNLKRVYFNTNKQKNKYKDICKSERWYANKNKELNNYWIYLHA